MWMVAARRGLQLLLQAKIAPGQRQAALRLVAAFSQLAKPTWLLVRSHLGIASQCGDLADSDTCHSMRCCFSSESVALQGDPDCTFFRVLVELVRVEIVLLLRDALATDAPVPADWTSVPSEAGLSPDAAPFRFPLSSS